MPFGAGDRVFARGESWIVEEVASFPDCTRLSLSSTAGSGRSRACTLLHPFDTIVACPRVTCARAVGRRAWMRHLHAVLGELRTFGRLLAVRGAAIEILPFQLEPALALIEGRASRFLLADEVGLGKTIQAGLMLSELRQRGWCESALIVTPAVLRQQWADELEQRFGIHAAILDAAAIGTLASALPFGVNPWTVEPVAITSIDFVKRPEVLHALTCRIWDMLIVDEAHEVPTAPLRSAAIASLGSRSRNVVMLTATPHAGDEPAYRSLCCLGQAGRIDPLLLFRRTRADVGMGSTRRAHLLAVRLTPDALEMHARLREYARRLWHLSESEGRAQAQLVALVLSKRAFSCAASLAASIRRRLTVLSGDRRMPAQPPLPLDSDGESTDEDPLLFAPAFDRPDTEHDALSAILSAAERAMKNDHKVGAVERLLRRTREPAIVFTEYRDTLDTLMGAVKESRRVVSLHGALTSGERRAAVAAFTSGAADLLLATDAGSQGLNLQGRCRLVINLELPWNPVRLEQRIGRVDRIGQTRTVHAVNLYAAETAESTVLANLVKRLQRIRASEIDIASCVISGAELKEAGPEPPVHEHTVAPDLEERGRTEAGLLIAEGAIVKAAVTRQAASGVPVTSIRRRRSSVPDQAVIWFVRSRIVNGAGRLVEDALVPILVPHAGKRLHRTRDVRAYIELLMDDIGSAVTARVEQHLAPRTATIAAQSAEWVARALARERLLVRTTAGGVVPIQAGLFDSRAIKRSEAAVRHQQLALEQGAARIRMLEAGSTASLAQRPEIALVIVTC